MNTTIAAIASGVTKAGIGIVRLSGPDALAIGKRIFRPASDKEIGPEDNKRLVYGHIYDGDDLIDEVLIAFMEGPGTYTAEDTVEIYCHGSIISLRKVLDLVLKEGARLADRGEFTRRAFLNGRLDLSQAEAVGDLIDAETESAYEASLNQLRGSLSQEIENIQSKVQDLLASMEVIINFSEDEDYLDPADLDGQMEDILVELNWLIASSEKGRLVKHGIDTAILGKPNVGKSSLLNALLRQKRAIVTDIPGTTRDAIEEKIVIDSVAINIIDTAGIRQTDDLVERLGVEKSIEFAENADLIIGVFDSSRDLDEEDEQILALMEGKKSLAFLNKTDLDMKVSPEDLEEKLDVSKIILGSIEETRGIEELEEAISDMFYLGQIDSKDSLLVTNARHVDLLKKAKENIKEAQAGLDMGLTIDMVEVDVRSAWLNLGRIRGQNMETEELLDQIFDEFCIGK